jgi:hypothetical protein
MLWTMRRRTAAALSLVLCLARFADSLGTADRDPALDRGIKQVAAGEWKQGLGTLSEVVRRLSKDKERAGEVAEACLYSGLAYVGLGETSPAISQFAQALMRNPQIKIPVSQESRAALDAFEIAPREAVAPVAAHAGGNKSKAPLIVAGAAVVAGAGVAIAAGGGGSSADSFHNPVPPTFTATGATGTPQLLLLSAVPPSRAMLVSDAVALCGMPPGEYETAVGGREISRIVKGRERYPVNVRYARDFRDVLIGGTLSVGEEAIVGARRPVEGGAHR